MIDKDIINFPKTNSCLNQVEKGKAMREQPADIPPELMKSLQNNVISLDELVVLRDHLNLLVGLLKEKGPLPFSDSMGYQ